MSHFTVVVIGDDVDEQLAPYTEQGFDEKYGVFEDKEDEYRTEYETEDVEIVVLTNGTLHTKYDKCFKDKSSGYSSDYVYPSDAVIRNGKYTELYPTFEDFMREWHGSEDRDEEKNRYGYWHNPKAKHDWYVIGGRWTGYFKPKAGAMGEVGESGSFGNKGKDGWVDSLALGDIDFDAMKEEAIQEANETYDKLESILQGRALPSWNLIREKHGENIDQARAEYHSLQVVKDLNAAQFWAMGDLVEVFGHSREEYVERQKNHTAVPYAVVKEGKWYEKGEMGWFGMSHGEMSQDEWNKQFWTLLEGLEPDTTITLVDCHI